MNNPTVRVRIPFLLGQENLDCELSLAELKRIISPFKTSNKDLAQLPTNYLYKIWKPTQPSGYVGSYLKAGWLSLDNLLIVIAEHFDESTTLVMAEELLAFHGITADPNAYFTAILFLYLSSV